MASFTVLADFPKVCDFRFTEVIDPTPANYLVGGVNTDFDQKPLSEMTMYWQTFKPYYQKRTFNDKCTVMVNTNYVDPSTPEYPELTLVDSNFALIANLTFFPFINGAQRVAGNAYIDPLTNVSTPLDAFQWQFYMGNVLSPTQTGVYYLQMRVYGDAAHTVYRDYRSESILVYSQFPGTVLLEAKNYTNRSKQNVLAGGWIDGQVPTFQSRVEAMVMEYNPEGVYIAFIQAMYLEKQLNAENFRTFMLKLGYLSPGVPAYMYEKISEQIITDYWTLNGVPYIYKSDGSDGISKAWQSTDPMASNLLWADIPIRERFANQQVFINVTPTADLLLWEPTGYPYAMPPWVLTGGTTGVFTFPHTIIDDVTAAAAWETYLNSTFLPTTTLTGSVVLVGDDFYYVPGAGESPSVVGSVRLFYHFVTFEIKNTVGIGGIWSFQGAGVQQEQVTDWGDGSAYTYYTISDSAYHTQSHTFISAPGPIMSARVFHNDKIQNWRIEEGGTYYPVPTAGLYEISGNAGSAPGAVIFIIQDCADYNPPADMAFINNSPNLFALNVSECNTITSFSNLFTAPLNSLLSISIVSNPLTATAVDDAFIDFEANTWNGTSIGTFTITCLPSQPPTAASLAARTALTTAGWTLTHD